MKKCVGYIRLSTQEQDEKFGAVAQKQQIKEYAENHGYEVVAWFQDIGSGVSDERPEWNKILFGDDIINPPFQAVIVFKSDRVARDTKLYFYYLYLLEKKGVELISVEENFNGDQAFANIYRSMMLFVAEQERKNIALRTSHGRKIKACAGGYSGGRTPYGYTVKDGQLEIVDDEAKVVKEIFALNDDGVSQVQIAKYLNSIGLKTRNGKEWSQPLVRPIILKRKLYQGFYKYGSKSDWVKGVHTPII